MPCNPSRIRKRAKRERMCLRMELIIATPHQSLLSMLHVNHSHSTLTTERHAMVGHRPRPTKPLSQHICTVFLHANLLFVYTEPVNTVGTHCMPHLLYYAVNLWHACMFKRFPKYSVLHGWLTLLSIMTRTAHICLLYINQITKYVFTNLIDGKE